MLLSKDEKKTFDKLHAQLCMFERNITKNVNSENQEQEALVVESKGKRTKKKYSEICHYCQEEDRWVETASGLLMKDQLKALRRSFDEGGTIDFLR